MLSIEPRFLGGSARSLVALLLRFSDSINVERARAIKQSVVTYFLVLSLDRFQAGL